jgi:hypothetical protein
MGSGEFGGRTRGGLEESGWEGRRCHAQGTGLIYSSGLDEVHVSDDVRFSLRYSDDDHIARELGPLHQAAPCRPGPPRQPGYPRASIQAGPTATLRPGPGWPSWLGHARRGRRLTPARAITTDARPVPQAATMNAAPGPASRDGPDTSMTARTSRRTCRCLDGAAPPAVMPAWRGQKMVSAPLMAGAEADSSARQNPSALLTFRDAALTLS